MWTLNMDIFRCLAAAALRFFYGQTDRQTDRLSEVFDYVVWKGWRVVYYVAVV